MIKLGVEYKFYLLPAISVFASHTLLLEVYYGGVLSILPSFILFFFPFIFQPFTCISLNTSPLQLV